MIYIYLIGGLICLIAGSHIMEYGLIQIIGNAKEGKLMAGFVKLLSKSAAPVMALSAALAFHSESAFLIMMLFGISAVNVFLLAGVKGWFRPYVTQRVCVLREFVCEVFGLLGLVLMGMKTMKTGHESVSLGIGAGIFFLLLVLLLLFLLMATSMEGYRLTKPKIMFAAVPSCLLGVLGFFVMMAGAGFLAEGITGLFRKSAIYPALPGFIFGMFLGIILCGRSVLETKEQYSQAMFAGISSMSFLSGLAMACFAGPITLFYPVAILAAIMAIACIYMIIVTMSKKSIQKVSALSFIIIGTIFAIVTAIWLPKV